MADSLTDFASALDGAPEKPPKRLRKRSFKRLDAEEVVTHVLEHVRQEQEERSDWMDKRLLRYAKMRGWTERDNPPWDDASNVHVPIMMANSLRVKAGLFNAVLGIRPVMTAKVVNKKDREAAEKANQLIDYQVFMEADGEQRIDRYIADFVDEGTAVAFTGWHRDKRPRYDTRVLRRPDRPLIEFLATEIPESILPGAKEVIAKDADGYSWTAVVRNAAGDDIDVSLEVYEHEDDDNRIDLCLSWDAVGFDGPTITVHDLEDIVVPMRCENAQPVRPWNPFGAPHISRLIRVPVDHVRRLQKNGTYDLLSNDDLEEIEGLLEDRIPTNVQAQGEDAIKAFKDRIAGLQRQYGTSGEQDDGWVTVIEYYGGWDLDGDGLDEEVIFWVLKEAKKLARVRYLTELYPGEPEQRPFADARCIPVAGEFYGIGYPELMEGSHDLLHTLFNQNLDRGDLANQPFFFYRASSGLKPDIIRMWPGDGFPLDNPQTDVAFPQMPHADQTWSFNMIGLAMQFLEKLTQIGPLQMGQVPQGKASALRTMGTTMTLLQQGAAMPEQILRRLFRGLATIWQQIHQLNTRFLPKKKQFLISGVPLDQDDAYQTVVDPAEISVPIAFDFEATLLNTNKGLVSQALVGLGQALVNPLMLQSGIVKTENIYNWAKDLIQANQLDPARYISKPVGLPDGPRMTFEEALLAIIANRLPEVAPLEPMDQHFQKAMAFMQSDQLGILTDAQVILFKEYLMRLQAALRAQLQQQQMADAAQAFAASLGNEGRGAKAVPGAESAHDPTQTEAGSHDEMMGAIASGGTG